MTGVQISVIAQSRGSDCVFRSLSINYLFFPVGWSLIPVLSLIEVPASVSLVLRLEVSLFGHGGFNIIPEIKDEVRLS